MCRAERLALNTYVGMCMQTYACAEPRDFSKLCYGGSTLKRERCVTMQQQAEATIKSTKSGETTPKRYDKVDQYSHVGSMTCKAL